MRTLRLTLAYDGTRYAGWQRQQGQRVRTVQGELEHALHRILGARVSAVASGRTDAGAHALAQVVHVRTPSRMPSGRLRQALNYHLPPDIAVLTVADAPPAFHAQRSAIRKRYRYRVFTGPVVPPFIRPYVHHVRVRLHLARMRREAAALRGRHDFRAFARRSGAGRASTVRTIFRVALRRQGPELRLEVEGNGFLHTMVRSVVGTLLDVGRGRLSPGTVSRMLATGNRALAGQTAPAKGLALVSVTYRGR